MRAEDIAKTYLALYPEELVEKYNAGERNFAKINLLKTELEYILRSKNRPITIYIWHSKFEKFNPLWADFTNPAERWFEWDNEGRFVPTEHDDLLPPRDLSGINLSGINLEGAYLYPVSLRGADLSGANLRNTILIDTDFTGANLSKADLRYSMAQGTFQGANLYMARLEKANLIGADLRKANLRRAKLKQTNLTNADLREAELSEAHFNGTILSFANLVGTSLQGVKLHNVNVAGVNIAASQQSEFLAALSIRLFAA